MVKLLLSKKAAWNLISIPVKAIKATVFCFSITSSLKTEMMTVIFVMIVIFVVLMKDELR